MGMPAGAGGWSGGGRVLLTNLRCAGGGLLPLCPLVATPLSAPQSSQLRDDISSGL